MDPAKLVKIFGSYGRLLLSPYDVGTVLYRLTDHVVEVLEVDGAGLSMAQEGDDLMFVAGTGALVSATEQELIGMQEGPSYQAYDVGEPVAVDDLPGDDRWPAYRQLATAQDVGAVLAMPMPVSERRIGVLTLYQYERHQWTDLEIETAQVLADMASGTVLNATALDESRNLAGQLQQALDSRVIIEQAKGLLAGRNDISPHEAFEKIRSRARNDRRRVHDIAQQVVEDRLDL